MRCSSLFSSASSNIIDAGLWFPPREVRGGSRYIVAGLEEEDEEEGMIDVELGGGLAGGAGRGGRGDRSSSIVDEEDEQSDSSISSSSRLSFVFVKLGVPLIFLLPAPTRTGGGGNGGGGGGFEVGTGPTNVDTIPA